MNLPDEKTLAARPYRRLDADEYSITGPNPSQIIFKRTDDHPFCFVSKLTREELRAARGLSPEKQHPDAARLDFLQLRAYELHYRPGEGWFVTDDSMPITEDHPNPRAAIDEAMQKEGAS